MSDRGSALVVEDETLIAFALEDVLLSLGFGDVRVATTIAEAAEQIAQHPPSVAVLDVNIRGERSYALVPALRARSVPFVFATGYGDSEHPADLRGVPTVTKPYSVNDIDRALVRAMQVN